MPALGALNWQVMQIGLGAGLFTKTDKRFSSPPSLDIARDIQFEELGGVQARLPFAAMSNTIFGGGTLSNCRRLAVVNGELLVITDTAVFSWNAQLGQWISRGTHLAVTLSETPRFSTTGDQIDADRAELNGTVIFAWTEGSQVFAAALDKTTGSVLVSPTAVSTAIGRPRLVALASKILLFVEASTILLTVRAIDPASPSGGITGAGTTVLNTNYNLFYDVVRAGTQDLVVGACRRQTTTSYETFTVTPGLVVTNSTKARICDGPIAVSTIPDGTKTQIARCNAGAVEGDLLTTSSLADIFTAQPIGTASGGSPFNQIAAAHQSVTQGGQFRCYVFWSDSENPSTLAGFGSRSNWIDTGNTHGSQTQLVNWVGIGSRAFDYNGRVYVWLTFGEVSGFTGGASSSTGQLQNAYFLYRDDGFLVAKSVFNAGGGLAPTTGRLPGVALTSDGATYSWAGTQRRSITFGTGTSTVGATGNNTGYAARSPVDVVFTFDSNEARRAVQLGATLYIASAEGCLQYDGTQLAEVGFHVAPWRIDLSQVGPGSLANGTYGYKVTYRWNNAVGELDRSTSAIIANGAISGGPSGFIVSTMSDTLTHKTSPAPAIAVEVWRTTVNPTQDAPFYLITSVNPLATDPNGYLTNPIPGSFASTHVDDELADASASVNQINPENDGVLESLAPPAAKIVIATDVRLFLAGIAGDPDRVWYSRERNDGEVASFNDALTIDVPPTGGNITALWVMDGVLYVGRQYAIYALPGVGFDNGAGGSNYGPAQIVSLDVGPVSQEAQCLTPLGVVFRSSKGWYLCDRGRNLRYVGAAVNAFDTDTVLSIEVMTALHEMRVLTNNRMLVWTYTDAVDLVDAQTPGGMGQWSERTISDGLDAILWNGSYVYLTSTGPKQEQASYSGLTYAVDVETSWIKLNGLQGYGKTSEIMILGEYRSAHLLRIRLARDYQYDGAGNVVYFDDRAWNPSPTTAGSALQVRHSPSASNGNCEAIKVRITAVAESVRATLVTNTALSPTVTTNGTAWAATWAAANTGAPGVSFPGLMGNSITMTVAFASGSTPSIDVRDHFTWNAGLGRWRESLNNVGVLVTGTNASTTVATLEAAIAAASHLCTLQTPDGTPGKLVAIATLAGSSSTGAFAGGAYTSPTGEAIKLTGIALRVGLKPSLYGRLPAAQKE